jgi:transcriptional regulator with XRE-family HTH domain
MNDERTANAVDRKLGQRVRTRRLEIGMSQERLAELLGVTFNRIAASRLFDISAALDMPVSRFFEGLTGRNGAGPAETSKDYIDDALATPEGAQLMGLFASIKSLKVRRRVIELVKALTEEAADAKR